MRSIRLSGSRLLGLALLVVVGQASGAEAPQTFSPQELRQDLAELEAQIYRIHPDVEHSVRKADLARALSGVRARLDRSMTREEAWVTLAALNPVMSDGHLVVTYPGGSGAEISRHLSNGGRLFPFDVHVAADGELFIRSAFNGEASALQGRRIDAIDGVAGRQISERLLAHVNGDTPALRAALLSMRFPFFYWKLYGDKQSYRLKVAGVESLVEGRSEMPLAYADRSFEQLFRFEMPNPRQAVLTVNEFYWREKPKFYEFTRAAFARMKAAGAQTLVIDIRANTGGDDDMWLEGLMPYVADKPYRNGSDSVLKVIEGRQKQGQKVGDVVRGSQSTYQPSDNPLRFTGKVYVLIGPATYSSAILFTNAVQDYGFATVVGTGGAARATQSGGTQNVKLSRTQIGLVAPRFLLKRPSGAAGLVQPDVLIPDDPFRAATAIEALLRL
ncbi:MAG TPA: S41 family peptidase [Steroidobacteraceae bacterium]|nr:S41 family peptidase [Steroidobacteraceae bacterium]